jgi:hypothetical protein
VDVVTGIKLGLGSPWARGALRDLDERRRLEALIPDGSFITVMGGKSSRGPWTLVLLRDGRQVDRVERASTIEHGVNVLLSRNAGVTVTTDGAGYITSIEEV